MAYYCLKNRAVYSNTPGETLVHRHTVLWQLQFLAIFCQMRSYPKQFGSLFRMIWQVQHRSGKRCVVQHSGGASAGI